MTTTVSLPSPAKLNLFLHINGQLDNGYHELQSLFTFVDFNDQLQFTFNNDKRIALTSNRVELAGDDNLIIKAVHAFHAAFVDQPNGIDIHLDKVIPMGAGLGGGSSNAATTLLALNHMYELNIDLADLINLGAKLGADVPIFLFGQSAIAEGIGEKLRRYSVADKWYLIADPGVHINTKALFGHPDLPRTTKKLAFSQINYTGLASPLSNDFQHIVCKDYPVVAKALDWLLEYAPARLTGTGSCVFAEFDTESAAQSTLKTLPSEWRGYVAKGLDQSPVQRLLKEQYTRT